MSDQSLPDIDFGDLFGYEQESDDDVQGGFDTPAAVSPTTPVDEEVDWDDNDDDFDFDEMVRNLSPDAPVTTPNPIGTQTPTEALTRRQGATQPVPEVSQDGTGDDDDILSMINDLSLPEVDEDEIPDDAESFETDGFWDTVAIDEDDVAAEDDVEDRAPLPEMNQLLGEGMLAGINDLTEDDDVIEEFSWDDDEEEPDGDDDYDNDVDEDSDDEEFVPEDEESFEEDMFATQKRDPESVEDTQPAKKKKDGRKQSSDVSILDNLKKKFSAFIAQAAAEFRGQDAPSTEPKLGADEEPSGRLALEAPPGNKSGNSPLTKIMKPYTFVSSFFLNILTALLGVLSKIPLIGVPFKMLLGLSKVLAIVANLLPVAVLAGVLVVVNIFMIPSSAAIELPDNGGASFTGFAYDKEAGSATGLITNTGDIIAVVKPSFTVFAYNPRLTNPKSWVLLQEQATCVADPARVDIDMEQKVAGSCDAPVNGFIIKVSGELNE